MYHNNRYNHPGPSNRGSFTGDFGRDYSFYDYTPQNHYYEQSTPQPPQQRNPPFQHQYNRSGPTKNQNYGQNHKEKTNFVPMNIPNPNPNNDDYKSYICRGCSQHFDCQSRNNRYMGRVPLILNCHHTVCQECIYKGAMADNIKCPVCKQPSEITKKHLVDNVQEAFPPNFYLFGLIMWTKPHGNSYRQPMLVPTQVTLNNKKLNSSEQASPPAVDTGEICCFVSCNKMAVLRCKDCNDVYCVDCCTVVHKSAKSLWCHIQVPITKDKFSAELEKCPYHNMDVELFCRTCEAGACCYCFLDKHEGHNRDFLSKLSDEELDEFRMYKEKAEKILKQLIISQKKLKNLCSNSTSALEGQICSYFANLHADFYYVQKKLQKQVSNIESIGKSDSGLDLIGSNLNKLIETLKNLLISADGINHKKINLRGLLQKLRDVQNTPCYLLTEDGVTADPIEFKVDPILKNADELFEIIKIEDCKFTLVGEDELPPDYIVDPADESDAESCISSLLSSCKKDDASSVSGRTSTMSISSTATKLTAQKKKKDAKHINNHLQFSPENEMVEVTHIESLECFYVQYKKMQSRFNQMNKDIENYIKMGASPVENPQINELYLAMYVTKKEKMWCRGRIIEVKSTKSRYLYEVFFIDYGSTQTLTLEKLREITPNLAQRKAFAIQCELYNPTLANWTKNAHVYMGKMINGKNVYMMVKNNVNGIHQVDLMVSSSDKGLTSIIDILIHTCSNALSSSSDNSSVASQRKDAFVPECKIFSNSIKFKKHQIENVVLANVIDPHHIFVHIAAYVDALRKMTGQMKSHYKNTSFESCIPIEGTYVVVEYRDPIRGAWHRALVKKVDVNSAKAHVLLVDWGNNVVIPWANIRLLHDMFTRLESQAILIKLAHVEPCNSLSWPEKATTFLQKALRTQDILKMIVHNVDPLEVALFENSANADICINAQLVEEGLANSTGKISKTLVWPQNEQGQPHFTEEEGFLATLLKKGDESLAEESEEEADIASLPKQQIEVVKVVSPDLIHIKFPHLEHQELTLHKELQVYYQKERKTKETWEEMEDCVVIFNEAYVRGKILGKEGEKYKVNVYDKVTETVLSKEKIFIYSDYFRKYPNVVFKSHLANIRPAGGEKWSLTSIEALEKVFDKHKDIYGTRVKGDVSRKSMPMLMWYTIVEVSDALEPSVTKFVSINNLLVKIGFAYKLQVKEEEEDDKTADVVEPKVELTVAADVHASDDKSDRSLNDSVSTLDEILKLAAGLEEKSSDETKEKASLDTSSGTNASSTNWIELMEKEAEEPKPAEETESKQDSPYHTREAEIVDWKPAFPIKKREFNAWITCAETEGILYLRDEDLQVVYKDMEANLKQYFDSQPPLVKDKNDWRPGQICTISYKDYWYRGKILKVKSAEEIVAIMIDFGSDHVLSPKQLYREILYPEIPAFASKIKLKTLFAKTGMWLDSDYQMLLEKITEYARVVIEGPLNVETPLAEVFLQSGASLNQILANICPNLTRCLDPVPEIEEDSVVIEKEEPLGDSLLSLDKDVETHGDHADTTSTEFQVEPLSEIALKGKTLMAIIGILSYNKIVIKKLKESEEELFELSENIQECYAMQPVIKDIKMGMSCICPYSDDGVWYRARVHNIDGIDCGYVFVFYVDFGNVESVATKDIRMMKPEWFKLPVSCYIATLNFELKTDNHVEHVFQHIKKLHEKVKLVEIVSEDPLTVNLFEKNDELCYQSLMAGGLLKVKF